MKCPSCKSKIDEKQAREKADSEKRVRCPECQVWLKEDPKASQLLNIGFFTWLAGTAGKGMIDGTPDVMMLLNIPVLVGLVMMAIWFVRGKWITA
ncbi:hypothetical protein ACFFLZ_10115 [Photobacterium aphoticum]|uniref:Uncharacterized protein n=1 Tax=Photobacterium aphoticum TaxID=754436 RepID=A0A0J1GH61_9GAMM|nr:hypothetical protein [Photobacterium aphoticum]KLU98828.1 hypothetical protein ABT58_20640 [Photobacterium aphoticum]PSU56759.1 hypothetical protein C9I90_11840 [Photobacterium aphoticum]GHA65741.1 hypothetical protein GCM10007086_44190 [Photobacterium aphoticum]